MSAETLADEVEQALALHGVTSSRKPTPAADAVIEVSVEAIPAWVHVTIAYAHGSPRDHRVAQRAAEALSRWQREPEVAAVALEAGSGVTVYAIRPPDERRIACAFYRTMILIAAEPIPVGEHQRLDQQAHSQAIRPMMEAIAPGERAEEGTAQARAYEAMVSHPEPFGRCLAYVVFGANAGFAEAEEFHRAGIDDYMNRTAEGLGFTGYAELYDTDNGWLLNVNRYR